jgi:type IV pilus assembly protein PilP
VKNNRFMIGVALVFASVILAGCLPTGEDELQAWMAEQRATTKPRITPLTEPKKFEPAMYAGEGSLEPFNQLKLTQALRRDSNQVASNVALIAPEMARRKEALEAFPLDAMSMVGSLNKANVPTALLKVDNLLYQVKAGDYLGQNYGKILRITENSIKLREIVQDATGDWIERSTSLELQEGKK